MPENRKILDLIRRILWGAPLVIACMVVAILVARKMLAYTTPSFEAVTRIKLDESSYGVSSVNLFKDFDVFSGASHIAAEVELLRSETILKKVAARINADHSLFRVGSLRETELLNNRPFEVTAKFQGNDCLDRDLALEMDALGNFTLTGTITRRALEMQGRLGDTLRLPGLDLVLRPGQERDVRGEAFDLAGQYRLRFHSPEKQLSALKNGSLDVKASDDDVPIIRIAYRHASPVRAAEIANAIAETYIEDHIAYKTQAATMTLKFIDDQIEEVETALINSEAAVEEYRDSEKVINTRQETETNLRKIAEMNIQLANIQMREHALDSLDAYINAGNRRFQDLALSFEAFGDLLLTELLKKVKAYEAERIDLLMNYTEESRTVQAVDAKIAEIVSYIKESVGNARKNMVVKRATIETAIAEFQKDFEGLPARERQLVILDREFQLNQKLYLFLKEKRMESSIQESAAMSFHRIIEKARVVDTPVSPQPGFVSLVAGFVGLMIGIGIIVGRSFFSFRLTGATDLEKRSLFPVLGTLPRLVPGSPAAQHATADLASRMLVHGDRRYVAVASESAGVGKTLLASGLAEALVAMGRKVALVDLDLRKQGSGAGIASAIATRRTPKPQKFASGLHQYAAGDVARHPSAVLQHPLFKEWWQSLAEAYDFVIVDTAACDDAAESLSILQDADVVVWTTRQGVSRFEAAEQPDLLAAQFEIGPFLHVFNDDRNKRNPLAALRQSFRELKSILHLRKPQNSLEH